MTTPALAAPAPGAAAAVRFVAEHLGHLIADEPAASPAFRGGQTAADAALAAFDVTGYATARNEVHPAGRRGASALSPWIRHGLLPLTRVWEHVADGPTRDVTKFRDELLWQEYARHWYLRLGRRTARATRHNLGHAERRAEVGDVWSRGMACLDLATDELRRDGWLVNQTRMWLASHWTVRARAPWAAGEDHFFTHLLDGSRAANRLGWQWTTGAGSTKAYGFSRWQVEKRAPGLCASCPRRTDCPIERWADADALVPLAEPDATIVNEKMRLGDPAEAGPAAPVTTGVPEAVWLTGESLGDDDPALAAHPELPAVFVFDEPLLARLQLSAKRLAFIVECLADLGQRRSVEIMIGYPGDVLGGCNVAVTWAPVPGWTRRADAIRPVEIHPWPWLRRPAGGPVRSFSAWRRRVSSHVVTSGDRGDHIEDTR